MNTAPAQQSSEGKEQGKRRWRQIAMLILALLIAAIFLSSYFTLQNIGTGGAAPQGQNKTVAAPETVYGVATANATISGYNDTVYISVSCSNQTGAVNAELGQVINALERNNSVYNFYSLPNETVVQAGTMNTLSLYSFLGTSFNASSFSCLGFSTMATVELPEELSVFITNKTYSLAVPSSLRYSQVPVTLARNMSSIVRVRVSALVTTNGTIYSLSTAKLGE